MDMIKLAIKCSECSSFLMKPVTLPCGSSVCLKHLQNLDNQEFFCKLCASDHHIEPSYMNVNKGLEILIKANLNKFNFGPEYKAAFDECNQLDQTINDLDTLRKDPPHFIKEIIGKLKNKTELIREEYKLKIDDKANQIITQLDKYENECIKNLQSSDFIEKNAKMDENIKKLKKDLEVSQNTLNDFSSNENQWKTIKQTSYESNVKLKQETSDLKTQLLIEKLNEHLQFVYNFQEIKLISDLKLNKEMEEFNHDLVHIANIDIRNSKVIDNSQKQQLLTLCNISSDKKWKLIYRGSEHGFTANDFHEKCDNIPNTLTIIKSTSGYIFGGFTSQTWNQTNILKNDRNAYLFSLVNPQNQPQKLMIKDPTKAIVSNPNYGPVFGNGNDLAISFNSNSSSLGNAYPQRNSNQPYLTESRNFTISDIDIYQIV